MFNQLLLGAVLICCCLKGSNSDMTALTTSGIMDMTADKSGRYSKMIEVPATEYMPELSFELTGTTGQDGFYYPVKLAVRTNGSLMQELFFDEKAFSPCTMEDFGFEYGDFRFDGYGGFRIYGSSMGRTPSCYFWMWDKEEHCFAEYTDLEEIAGYMTFDYKTQLVHVSATASAARHEFTTYQYIDDKLTLIEMVVDTDYDGYRKVYQFVGGEMRLTEVTESHLRG